jgi:2-C-methyl-D-erythritol 4-phosphate cytidylyltransferase
MVVVAAGTGSRFAGDKTLVEVDGRPLVAVTVERLKHLVDELVLVCRRDQWGVLADLGVPLVEGGDTRTESEIAGLRALAGSHDLVGIHDGARPNVFPELVERLFAAAASSGGAIPVIAVGPLVEVGSDRPVRDAFAAQTPQVFAAGPLLSAYTQAERDGFTGHDTADVVQAYTDLEVTAVDGDPRNGKVTFPEDLQIVIP